MGPARRSTNLWHWKYEQVLNVRSLVSWLWHSMGHRSLGKSTAVSIIFGQLFAVFLLHPSGYCAKAEAGGRSKSERMFQLEHRGYQKDLMDDCNKIVQEEM